MAPIINPPIYNTAADSWQAWGPCVHLNKETQTMSVSSDVAENIAERSEPVNLNENMTLDQAVCSNKETGELQSDVRTGGDEIQCGDEITNRIVNEESGDLEIPTTTPDTVLSGGSDQSNGSTDASITKQECSADQKTASSSKETSPTVPPTTDPTSSGELARDTYISAGDSKVSVCPECEKERQQKEKPFLNKSKSCGKFVWNRYLLKGFEGAVHPDWILHIVNGFVGQSGILFICSK